ncbi:MAG TPA: membrane-associated protein [Hadesarchaea archaeon]|nr:membrane-associated protein [Hadesarchaea archaeon]
MAEKLNVKALAIGVGTAWAACMLFLGWASIFGLGTSLVNIISSVYVGFAPTVLGGIVGAVWGFIDGAIGGIVIALVYNYVLKKKW